MRRQKQVLLLEPNYSNKYPPIGLMKIASYHRSIGWNVVFYKGDLKNFIIERIADRCVEQLNQCDGTQNWQYQRHKIIEYIRTPHKNLLDQIVNTEDATSIFAANVIMDWKDYYRKGTWKNPSEREWDRVFVTTLFTFYWDITIETIEFAKLLVKKQKDLMVGGVLASIQPKELEEATGIKPFVGVLNQPGQLDKGNTAIIDELPLDYSILDEIDYKYPMSNAYYGYMSRGCIRKCPFCAVRIMEPNYVPYISLSDRVNGIRLRYGEQRDLLLMDNNVLASTQFPEIIKEIRDCGFAAGAKFTQPDLLKIAIENLKVGINDRAYIRKSQSLMRGFYQSLTNENESFAVYKILDKYHVDILETATKTNLLLAYTEIEPFYKKHFHPSSKLRFVDFNQGLDARLFNEENVKLLSSIAIRPLRVAFDDIKTLPSYEKAIRLSAAAGIKDFSNYLLYNFKDEPLDLYRRLRINVDMCDELNVNIYSFPMKYHPLRKEDDGSDFSHNRDYIGIHWNRKYIRAIQAILNSTKGKVGRGRSFFLEAFGSNE